MQLTPDSRRVIKARSPSHVNSSVGWNISVPDKAVLFILPCSRSSTRTCCQESINDVGRHSYGDAHGDGYARCGRVPVGHCTMAPQRTSPVAAKLWRRNPHTLKPLKHHDTHTHTSTVNVITEHHKQSFKRDIFGQTCSLVTSSFLLLVVMTLLLVAMHLLVAIEVRPQKQHPLAGS